jgi:hypothetical protein
LKYSFLFSLTSQPPSAAPFKARPSPQLPSYATADFQHKALRCAMQSHLPTHQTDLMNPHAIVLKIHSQSLIVPPSANFIEALI